MPLFGSRFLRSDLGADWGLVSENWAACQQGQIEGTVVKRTAVDLVSRQEASWEGERIGRKRERDGKTNG
jgi:predicted  nucleic acid-binding Zn ribbon protein